MKAMPENPNRGSSFEDFLKEEGILEASSTTAVKKVLAWAVHSLMEVNSNMKRWVLVDFSYQLRGIT
jgi:hypothetical protein